MHYWCSGAQPLKYDGWATVLKESADPLSSATAAAAGSEKKDKRKIDLSTHDSNMSTHKTTNTESLTSLHRTKCKN